MAKIKHIALTTQDPDKAATFYKEAFGLKEIRRSPNGAVFLTDGYINLAILNWKTEKDADVGTNGPNYSGIHHFGFEVDDRFYSVSAEPFFVSGNNGANETVLTFYGKDVAYATGGSGYVGTPYEFVRKPDGSVGWIRINGRIALRSA